ncbi:uncharacterized protein LOC134692738 [Mytilus trossulus]|uniref:uncharacterized protein LOC134692738 n=1 Tax=Mytilus trossulus TaxID=6551 RepID=UPI0030041B33
MESFLKRRCFVIVLALYIFIHCSNGKSCSVSDWMDELFIPQFEFCGLNNIVFRGTVQKSFFTGANKKMYDIRINEVFKRPKEVTIFANYTDVVPGALVTFWTDYNTRVKCTVDLENQVDYYIFTMYGRVPGEPQELTRRDWIVPFNNFTETQKRGFRGLYDCDGCGGFNTGFKKCDRRLANDCYKANAVCERDSGLECKWRLIEPCQ